MVVAVQAFDSTFGTTSSTTPSVDVNVNVGGANRVTIGIMAGRANNARDIESATLGGIGGTELLGDFAIDGGQAFDPGIYYWLDSAYASIGSGTKALAWSIPGAAQAEYVGAILQLTGAAQSSTFSATEVNTDTDSNQDNIGTKLDVSIGSAEDGNFGVIIAGFADGASAAGAVDCDVFDTEHLNAMTAEQMWNGIWTDDVIAAAGQTYSFEGSGASTNRDSFGSCAFAVRIAAAAAGGAHRHPFSGPFNKPFVGPFA